MSREHSNELTRYNQLERADIELDKGVVKVD